MMKRGDERVGSSVQYSTCIALQAMDGFSILNGMERALIQVVPPFIEEVIHLMCAYIWRTKVSVWCDTGHRRGDDGRTEQRRTNHQHHVSMEREIE